MGRKTTLFIFVINIFVMLLLSFAFADVSQFSDVNVTDIDNNASATLNLTNGQVGLGGHLRLNNSASGAFWEALNGAQLLWIGWFDIANSCDCNPFTYVPNESYYDFFNKTYGSYSQISFHQNEIVAVRVSNGSGGYYYGAVYTSTLNIGGNAVVTGKFNNQANNETFAAVAGCGTHKTFNSCISDYANSCYWQNGVCLTSTTNISFEIPPAKCEMLPRSACNGINSNVCSWNANAGTKGLCQPGANYDTVNGFVCANITNQSVCNNQPFTERTGLCTYNGTDCLVNKSKTHLNVLEPPVFSCEAPGYVDNQAKCNNLSDMFYLPCGWDVNNSKCRALFIDYGKFEDFEDISSENTCEAMGGNWKSETTYDPVAKLVTTEEWCEYGVTIKTFDQIGAGGGGFSGDPNELKDCSRDCFACEYNGTNQWSNSSVASSQCTNSAAGCTFRTDSHAFNGFGWCDPVAGFGGFDCDTYCGDCMLMPTPQTACINSYASCRWDNLTRACVPSGTKGCDQECMQCSSQTACSSSPAQGGCNWDSSTLLCTPKGGSFEICYDALDNDNNGLTDCSDAKCSSDPFCGGMFADTNNCFKYTSFTYSSGAQGNCTVNDGCLWINDSFGFSYCAQKSESCFMNRSLENNQNACNNHLGGNVCKFKSVTGCMENRTQESLCFLITNSTGCGSRTECLWNTNLNFCDQKTFVRCEDNETVQVSQNACQAAGCTWVGDSFGGGGFEGWHFDKCVSPCQNTSLNTQNLCQGAIGPSGTFSAGTCVWQTGFCEPKNFIGGCFDNDGDKAACEANSNCVWKESTYGRLKDLNGSTDFSEYTNTNEVWLAIGLQYPNITGTKNESEYRLNKTNGNSITLLSINNQSATLGHNITRLYCNSTVIMEYNWSVNPGCIKGACNQYNTTTICNGKRLHYFFSNVTGVLEALWEVNISDLILDSTEGNSTVTTLTNSSTVIINGNLSEHILENASANDASKAGRVRTSTGFCNDKMMNTFFAAMDNEPPIPVSGDASGDVDASQAYLDIVGLGLKKTPEAYAYGALLSRINGSAACYSVPVSGGANGNGKNTSKYYLYLDTNGVTTGGCSANDASTLAGFEYLFKYTVSYDSTTNRVNETQVTQGCVNGAWGASNVPLKVDREKGCNIMGGIIFGIDKDILTGKSDVNTSVSWRAYVTSASVGGNASIINDSAGPGIGDFKGIDVEILDCGSTEHKDNDMCSKVKTYGFFPGEFGPACADNLDNDGDTLVDCSDYDCTYDPFFCGGSFTAIANDKSAPSLVWNKVNSKSPTSLTWIYDTNEPSNGSVKFYHTDSKCSTLNQSLLDTGLTDGRSITVYRPHHLSEVSDLTANTTYYYKSYVCDPSGNCALSKCTNVTTAVSHSNVTFKLEIPPNWTIDVPSINLTNYSSDYALKASTQFLDDMNLTVNSPGHNFSITFVDLDIFEKKTLNISKFVTGTNYMGIDANQYQSFKQYTGVVTTLVEMPITGDQVLHCDDSGENCKDVTSSLTCTFGTTSTTCEVPDAVGLGFSTYKTSTATSQAGGGGGASGGGGIVTAPQSKTINSPMVKDTIYNYDLRGGDKVTFTYKGKGHSVEVKKVTSTEVELTVKSTPKTVKIPTGVRKNVDLDDDGASDLSILLRTIVNGVATIQLKLITPESISVEETKLEYHSEEGVQEEVTGAGEFKFAPPQEQPTSYTPTLVAIVIVVGLLLVAGVVFVRQKKK